MEFSAIIFDLDGTLLDSLHDIASSMNEALRMLGFPTHPVSEYRRFVGEGLEILVRKALPAGQQADVINRCVLEMKSEYARRWQDNTKPYAGVSELLSFLEERNIPKAILSNKPDEFTKTMVKTLLPAWSFRAVRGATPEFPKKPDPAAALAIAREFAVLPQEIIYLGDSNVDMQTARAAGMYAAGALWGFRSAEELREGGADGLLKQPFDAARLFTEAL